MPDPIMDDGSSHDPPDRADLSYRNAQDDRPQRNREIGIAIGAGLLAAVTIFGLVVSWVLENLQLGPPGQPRLPLHWAFSGPLTLMAISFWVWVFFFRPRQRLFILGALVGFGVAILIEGTCFFVNR